MILPLERTSFLLEATILEIAFSEPVNLSGSPGLNVTRVSTRPQVAANGSLVYVVWSEKIGSGGQSDIMMRNSSDFGNYIWQDNKCKQ